ncbi:hypothetical protein JM654_21590 [Microbacterium oxydans]|nr:hypothetical protein [Microbacterium oxydans]
MSIPRIASQPMPIVVATSSRMLPISVRNCSSERRPPAAAITAVEIPATKERIRSVRLPSTNDTWRIANAASAKARTATVVCTRSCQVKAGPTGSGHPVVHATWEATRNSADAIATEKDGVQMLSQGTVDRSPRAAHATERPPTTRSSRASSNHPAVGSPSAPRPLTYRTRSMLRRATQMMLRAAATSTLPTIEAMTRRALAAGWGRVFSTGIGRR